MIVDISFYGAKDNRQEKSRELISRQDVIK